MHAFESFNRKLRLCLFLILSPPRIPPHATSHTHLHTCTLAHLHTCTPAHLHTTPPPPPLPPRDQHRLVGDDDFAQSADRVTMPQLTEGEITDLLDHQDYSLWQSMSYDAMSAGRAMEVVDPCTLGPAGDNTVQYRAKPAGVDERRNTVLRRLLSRHLQMRMLMPRMLLWAVKGNAASLAEKLADYDRLLWWVPSTSASPLAKEGKADGAGEEGAAAGGESKVEGGVSVDDVVADMAGATVSGDGTAASRRLAADMSECVGTIGAVDLLDAVATDSARQGDLSVRGVQLDVMLSVVFRATLLVLEAAEASRKASGFSSGSIESKWVAAAAAVGEAGEAVKNAFRGIAEGLWSGEEEGGAASAAPFFRADGMCGLAQFSAHHLLYLGHTAAALSKAVPSAKKGGTKNGGKKGGKKGGGAAAGDPAEVAASKATESVGL